MFEKRKHQIRNYIEKTLTERCGEYQDLPNVGEYADDIYKVVICPVCENKTLDFYYICPHCGWEYDETKEGGYSSANHAALKEYRKIYRKIVTKMKETKGK